MKIKLTFFLLCIPLIINAQIDYSKEAKKDLKILDSIFSDSRAKLQVAQDSLKALTETLSPSMKTYYDEVIKIKEKTDSLYENGKTSLAFYGLKGVPKVVLDSVFSLPTDYQVGTQVKKEAPEETYLLFGDETLILKDSILKNPTAYKVFTDVLGTKSETYFGDFWFPEDGAEIPITIPCFREKPPNCEDSTVGIHYLKFDRLHLELYEGSIYDLTVYLKDDSGSVFVFENKSSISLLKFDNLSGRNYISLTSIQTPKKNQPDLKGFQVRVSDVLQYYTADEGNYVPNDVSYTFPLKTEAGKTNSKKSNRYELRQNTGLNNIIDLRAYTDLLGIGGETPNGIAQFEGQADFFISPFRLPEGYLFGLTNVFIGKKIKPYIQYSRLDEENQFLEVKDNADMSAMTLKEPLNHLQKSYLDAGVKLDLLSFKLGKHFPFESSFYGVARFQISKVKVDDISHNYKTLGAGGGLALEFRRLANFKFNISSEFTRYSQGSYNNIEGLDDPDSFWVFRNEFEVSYFPSKKKNNSIFMRMRVFDNQDFQEGSNFFQWQFGYRFTIGMGKLKTKS